jgi:hypothetical protein
MDDFAAISVSALPEERLRPRPAQPHAAAERRDEDHPFSILLG